MIKLLSVSRYFSFLSAVIFLISYDPLQAEFINSLRVSNGITVSKINHTIISEWIIFDEPFTGFFTGLEANFYENSFLSINSKLSCFEIGGTDIASATDEYGNEIGEIKSIEVFNYLSLNSTVKLKLHDYNFEPYISIGPRIDYMYGATNYYDDYKKFNYGFDLGIGFDKRIFEKLNLCADFTWNKQMDNIYKSTPSWDWETIIEPEYSYSITLGLEYILK